MFPKNVNAKTALDKASTVIVAISMSVNECLVMLMRLVRIQREAILAIDYLILIESNKSKRLRVDFIFFESAVKIRYMSLLIEPAVTLSLIKYSDKVLCCCSPLEKNPTLRGVIRCNSVFRTSIYLKMLIKFRVRFV